MKRVLVGILLLVMGSGLGCERVELRSKAAPPATEKPQAVTGDYLKDGKGGLFQNVKWYEYEMATHIIWTRLDVFALKTGGEAHKLQILSYYGSANEPGVYRLAVGREAGPGRVVEVDANACGNPFTNREFDACLADPLRNVFTYLNLRTLEQRRLTDAQALTDADWDVAFRGTEVKLNAGLSGPGDVVGGLLRRFDFFEENGAVAVARLRDPVLKALATEEFARVDADEARGFYLPDGIDRVMHERDWFSADPATRRRSARADRWWIVKSPVDGAYAKTRIAEIRESTDGPAAFATELRFETYVQEAGAPAFAATPRTLDLQFTSDTRSAQFCVSLVRGESWPCAKDRTDWDLRLLVVNQLRAGELTREWRFFVNEGARGPLSPEEATPITSGR